MRKNKIILILIISIITVFILQTNVNAAIRVVVKEGTGSIIKDKTISDYYDMCIDLTKNGNLLDGTSTTPHMSTNEDWGTVAYFANSLYGIKGCTQPGGGDLTNTDRAKGVETTINGVTYRSTTGNATGIMNMGTNPEYTAGVISNYENITEEAKGYGKSLIDNIESDTVTTFINSTEYKNKYASLGWFGIASWWNSRAGTPYTLHDTIFGMSAGEQAYEYALTGENRKKTVTFRVVIWN